MAKRTDDITEILKSSESLDDFLKENEGEFVFDKLSDWFEYYLITKKLEKAQVIADSGISREYAYQILKGEKNPSRDKLIMLCFGLQLNLEQTRRLLRYAGFGELYNKKLRDAIIMFGLSHGYDIRRVNEDLYDRGEEILK